MQTDEQELIARILDGHAEDFGYFLERYSQEAFAIVLSTDWRRLKDVPHSRHGSAA